MLSEEVRSKIDEVSEDYWEMKGNKKTIISTYELISIAMILLEKEGLTTREDRMDIYGYINRRERQ